MVVVNFFMTRLYFQGKKEKLTDKFIRPRGRLLRVILPESYIQATFVPFPSVLFSKRALKEIGGIPALEFAPDYYIALAIALKYDVVANSEVLCGYRLHSSNTFFENQRNRLFERNQNNREFGSRKQAPVFKFI